MTEYKRSSRARHWSLIAAIAILAAACGGNNLPETPTGNTPPDQFLSQRATDAMMRQRWQDARRYFQQIVDNYPQSPLRPDAKLAIGDTYLGEGTGESYVLAINEFQEFLSFYPTNPRADYAQFKLGMAHFRQMRSPQRDQTETRSAVRDFEAFVQRYPTSSLMPDVNAKLREARDNLGTWELEVGRHYLRIRWYPGAIDRLMTLLKQDPDYTRRDAVYFYLGESLIKAKRESEALPYLERLVEEFEKSEYLDEARKRIATLKLQAQGTTSS